MRELTQTEIDNFIEKQKRNDSAFMEIVNPSEEAHNELVEISSTLNFGGKVFFNEDDNNLIPKIYPSV